jgi:hypothetical protein
MFLACSLKREDSREPPAAADGWPWSIGVLYHRRRGRAVTLYRSLSQSSSTTIKTTTPAIPSATHLLPVDDYGDDYGGRMGEAPSEPHTCTVASPGRLTGRFALPLLARRCTVRAMLPPRTTQRPTSNARWALNKSVSPQWTPTTYHLPPKTFPASLAHLRDLRGGNSHWRSTYHLPPTSSPSPPKTPLVRPPVSRLE